MSAPIDPTQFDEVFDKAEAEGSSLDDWIASKASNYEERMVKLVMTRLSMGDYIPYVKGRAESLFGDNSVLSFKVLHICIPDLPLTLCTKNYMKNPTITLADVFKRITKLECYKAFENHKESMFGEQSGCLGLIFPLNGFGNLIIHNYASLKVPGTRLYREFTDGEIVYLDILLPFLDALSLRYNVKNVVIG